MAVLLFLLCIVFPFSALWELPFGIVFDIRCVYVSINTYIKELGNVISTRLDVNTQSPMIRLLFFCKLYVCVNRMYTIWEVPYLPPNIISPQSTIYWFNFIFASILYRWFFLSFFLYCFVLCAYNKYLLRLILYFIRYIMVVHENILFIYITIGSLQ